MGLSRTGVGQGEGGWGGRRGAKHCGGLASNRDEQCSQCKERNGRYPSADEGRGRESVESTQLGKRNFPPKYLKQDIIWGATGWHMHAVPLT